MILLSELICKHVNHPDLMRSIIIHLARAVIDIILQVFKLATIQGSLARVNNSLEVFSLAFV
jgi:hypothetical protein